MYDSLSGKYPSCLQTTMASGWPNRSSHTVPQIPPTHISRRPSISETPPTRRSSPVVQLVALAMQVQKTVTVTQSEVLKKLVRLTFTSSVGSRLHVFALPSLAWKRGAGFYLDMKSKIRSNSAGIWEHAEYDSKFLWNSWKEVQII